MLNITSKFMNCTSKCLNNGIRTFAMVMKCDKKSERLNEANAIVFQTSIGKRMKHNSTERQRQRTKTRKPNITHHVPLIEDEHTCITYATAEKYRFHSLQCTLSKCEHLTEMHLKEDIVHALCYQLDNKDFLSRQSEDGYIYFFKEGGLSFWNINNKGRQYVMNFVKPFQIEPYSHQLVEDENEKMNYVFSVGQTKFDKNHFQLCITNDAEMLAMEMYAFSNALIVSVKLAHWEHSLDVLIDSIQTLPNELIVGLRPNYKSSTTILQKIGKVFQIRHRVNLQNNYLEIPDEYWDHEDLEQLFVATTQYLSIPRRVRIMNEKLSYCAHMVEMVKSHLAEQKSIRIELLIVLLILIEVVFEVIHYFVAPYSRSNNEHSRPNDNHSKP